WVLFYQVGGFLVGLCKGLRKLYLFLQLQKDSFSHWVY
ncbi:hypothetical protein, partial [uncultured Gammaproteobacteria bacterium]